jgi:site-specific DNA recombinase
MNNKLITMLKDKKLSITEDILLQNFSKKAIKITKRKGNVCFCYDRVSSRDQMINGNSLVWQYERMYEFAEKNNLVIKQKFGGTFESAKTDERKEFQRMVEAIKKDESVAAIIIYCYDRFSRSGANGIFLLENLKKLGIRIISITQEVDSFTPTGSFQENLYMLLSKLDNDMRRDKSTSGTKSILKKGYWPYHLPIGYTNLNKHATADKHVYIINKDGQLIKKAFQWKASGKFTNQEIIEKLAARGLKITLRNMSWILSNPFYCGFISSTMLPNELIKGHYPAIIDQETFLAANNISSQNSRTGVPKKLDVDELPLKVFMKDIESLSPFTGYYHKKKNLFYYKSRQKGTKVNVSAKTLNAKFKEIISSIGYDKKNLQSLKSILEDKLRNQFANDSIDERPTKKRIGEIKGQMEIAEEQLVLNKISKEQFDKYHNKYADEIRELEAELLQSKKMSSNLEKAVAKSFKIAENIYQAWVTADYYDKQRLQYLIFPEGMLYDKKNNVVRTIRINSIFSQISIQSSISEENKKGNLLSDCLLGSSVGLPGFEPRQTEPKTVVLPLHNNPIRTTKFL